MSNMRVLNAVTVTVCIVCACMQQRIVCIAVTLYISLHVLHRLPLRHHRVRELICTQDGAFSAVGRFFFLMQAYRGFFHSLSLNKGETEGYAKLTAEEIAVKRSLHFSFSPTVFFSPVLPVLLAFSRHLDFQKTFY